MSNVTPRKPIACIDFDGVLHAYDSPWAGADIVADGPVPGAIAWLHEMARVFDVQVYSSRSSQPGGLWAMFAAIERWEREWQAELAIKGEPIPAKSILQLISFPREKPAAFISIDDRAFQFEGWFPRVEALLSFKPWNKRAPVRLVHST